MRVQFRWLAVQCLFVWLLSVTTLSAARIPATPFYRVRALDELSSILIVTGYNASDTFRRLVDDLERTDIIVYVGTEIRMRAQLAGQLQVLGNAPGTRYIRIAILNHPGRPALIAMIGHELQHALEVAHAPEVTDRNSLERHYETIGEPGCAGFETDAATDAQRFVAEELRSQ